MSETRVSYHEEEQPPEGYLTSFAFRRNRLNLCHESTILL